MLRFLYVPESQTWLSLFEKGGCPSKRGGKCPRRSTCLSYTAKSPLVLRAGSDVKSVSAAPRCQGVISTLGVSSGLWWPTTLWWWFVWVIWVVSALGCSPEAVIQALGPWL